MIDENVLIKIIHEQQAEDDKAYRLLYFDDSCTAIYKAKKSVRNKIIETIEDMSIVSRFADWLEEVIHKALEKQIPKKPIEKEVIGVSMAGYRYKGRCPECSSKVLQSLGNYCSKCGQALDWSVENES